MINRNESRLIAKERRNQLRRGEQKRAAKKRPSGENQPKGGRHVA